MARKRQVTFTHHFDGREIELLSAAEHPENGLMLFLHSADKVAAIPSKNVPPEIEALEGQEIIEQRYSVHPSPNSVEGVNVIKRHFLVDGEERLTYRHMTKALKHFDRFAPIYFRKVESLGDHHILDRSRVETVKNMGSMDHSFTLIFGVFVSLPHHVFSGPLPSFVNHLNHTFDHFKLTVLWTYVALPTIQQGHLVHFLTFDPKTETDPIKLAHTASLERGFSDATLAGTFLQVAGTEMMKTHGRSLVSKFPEMAHVVDKLAWTRYFGSPDVAECERRIEFNEKAIASGARPSGNPYFLPGIEVED